MKITRYLDSTGAASYGAEQADGSLVYAVGEFAGTRADSAETLAAGFDPETGATLVIITHDKALAAMCDRVVTLADGLIVSDVLS